MTNLLKGTAYELYIRDYLITELENKNENGFAYMWKDIPEKYLRESGILGNWNEYRISRKEIAKENTIGDTGCDILLKINEKYFIVQCKNYDPKFSVKMHDLNGFYMMMFHCNLDGKLYYNSKLSDKITMQKPTDRVEFIKKVFKYEPEKKDNSEKYTNLIENPYDYQIEAVKKLNEVYINKNRAILQLPCSREPRFPCNPSCHFNNLKFLIKLIIVRLFYKK